MHGMLQNERRSGIANLDDGHYVYCHLYDMKRRSKHEEVKLFISADIEGCAGVALTDETHKKKKRIPEIRRGDDRRGRCGMRSGT